MGKEIRADYEQALMFPPCLDDWVGPDHPARFIRDFVDSLDLEGMGFRVRGSEVGRPNYAPDLLLKVWLYGYFSRIRSTRKLEKACRENMGLIWLTGMNAPDHNSLWRFWSQNKKALGGVFKQSIHVAVRSELVGMAVHALDGTKIKARASRDKVRDQKYLERMLEGLDRTVADLMTEVERCEQEEEGEFRLPRCMQDELRRKQRIQEALKELDGSKKKVIHARDPEARFMKNRRSIELSYNAQAVADRDSGLIVAEEVVNEEADNGLLVPMLDRVKENLGAVAQENVEDAGYFSSSQIALAETRQYEVLVSRSSGEATAEKSSEENPYHSFRFIYDQEHDICICPQGNQMPFLQWKSTGANQREVRRYRCRDYAQCAHRSECTKSKKGRMIDVNVHQEALERHARKREDPKKRKLLRTRKAIIEPVFAWIKRHMGFRRWTVFGLENVRVQWSVVCATLNLKKLYGYWVCGRLILESP